MFKLSIITINFNNCKGLEKTIQSVVSQTNSNFEFIVIDGGSSDESLELINQHQSKINYWVSEQDKGIYDAQNKGIQNAKGEYVLFLNSGDSFYSTRVVEEFMNFTRDNNFKIIYGDSEILRNGQTELLSPPEKIDLDFWYRNTLNHQAVFAKKDLFSAYGLHNIKYKICADFDFLLKVFVSEPNEYKHFKCTVCAYDESGFSTLPTNYDSMLDEREEIMKNCLTPFQFNTIKNNYFKSLPIKQQFLMFIYERPVLKWLLAPAINLFIKMKGHNE